MALFIAIALSFAIPQEASAYSETVSGVTKSLYSLDTVKIKSNTTDTLTNAEIRALSLIPLSDDQIQELKAQIILTASGEDGEGFANPCDGTSPVTCCVIRAYNRCRSSWACSYWIGLIGDLLWIALATERCSAS